MLEFIVLGHIPGTQMQITIAWVQSLVLIVMALYFMHLELMLVHRRQQQAEEPRALRVRWIRRISANLRVSIARVKVNWVRLLARPGVH